MADTVTKLDVTDAVQTLASVYPLRRDTPQADVVETWYRTLKRVGRPELQRAVEAYLTSEAKYFPTPGQLLRTITSTRTGRVESASETAYREWYHDGMYGPCPVCGSEFEFRTGRRSAVYHDHQRHYEAGVGYHGPRTGPVDRQGRMLSAHAHETTQTVDDAPPF